VIRFVIGLFVVFTAVGSVEGPAGMGLSAGILIATAGLMCMLWGLSGMADKGQLV
jgi:hypothetical protein